MRTFSKIAGCAALGSLGRSRRLWSFRHAEEPVQNLGPVQAHEPILTTFGNKGVIAFYEPDGTHCALYAVVYNLADESGESGAQFRAV